MSDRIYDQKPGWPKRMKTGLSVPRYIEVGGLFIPYTEFVDVGIYGGDILATCSHCKLVWDMKRSKNWWKCPNGCWKPIVTRLEPSES